MQAPPETLADSDPPPESATIEPGEPSPPDSNDPDTSTAPPIADNGPSDEPPDSPTSDTSIPPSDPTPVPPPGAEPSSAPAEASAEGNAPVAAREDVGSLLLERELSATLQESDAESDEVEELLRKTSSRIPRRPDSAEVAALIEGYNYDFESPNEDPLAATLAATVDKAPGESHDRSRELDRRSSIVAACASQNRSAQPSTTEGLPPVSPTLAPTLGPDDSSASSRLQAAQDDQAALLATNERLQRYIRSVLDLRQKGAGAGDNSLGTAQARYTSLRQRLLEHRAMLNATEQHYERLTDSLREQLQTRLAKATSIQNALRHFIVEVGKGAEYPKTGKRLSEAKVESLHKQDIQKEGQLIVLRLKNIELNSKMQRLEQVVKQKEELAEGLHLIDFEQLKIENQALNEKIEERNEEVLKLKKKITTTAQILTHTREKLQFVQKKNRKLAREVAELDTQLNSQRDGLSKVKQRRDKLRSAAHKMKEASVYIDNPMLLADIQHQRSIREELGADLDELQRRDKLRSTAHKIKEASVNIDNPVILACMQHQRSFREELQAHLDERQAKRDNAVTRVADMTRQIMAMSQKFASPS